MTYILTNKYSGQYRQQVGCLMLVTAGNIGLNHTTVAPWTFFINLDILEFMCTCIVITLGNYKVQCEGHIQTPFDI